MCIHFPLPWLHVVCSEDLLVISFRDHHHSHDPADPNVTFLARNAPLSAWRRLIQFAFSIFIVHYFLWIIPMVGFMYWLWSSGHHWIFLLVLALYIRSFIDGSQYKSGRPWDGLRTAGVWRLTSRYIGAEIVRTTKLSPDKKYIFAFYPHGILILSRVAMYGGVFDRLFPGIQTRVLGASPMFWLPGSREICLWMSAVDAAKRVAANILQKFGLSLMVYPGGSDEIFTTDPHSSVTTLIARKGFIKLAIESGADICPAFVFGEKWLFARRELPRSVKDFFLNYLRTPLILFWGRFFTWLPYHDRSKAFLSIVFGRPISVGPARQPSQEEIDDIWEQYIEQMKHLFESYKGKFGYPDNETLVIQEPPNASRRSKMMMNGNKKDGKNE